MEGNITEMICKGFHEINNPAKELLLSVTENGTADVREVEISDPGVPDKTQEEETLKARLEELKKENFSLQASINAWQFTLNNKLDEFKEADLKLNKIYAEIWSERENFCSKTDEFNDRYGILSGWWERQMKFVSDLENLEKERLQDQKCRQEIKKLEMEVAEFRREEVHVGKQEVEVEVHATEGDFLREDERLKEVPSERSHTKKPKFLVDDQSGECRVETQTKTKNELFSMVDLEKLRRANRIKHRNCKTHFLTRMNKFLSG